MKGIILAAGAGTRLKPLTVVCNKQLLPVYDKPLIYYPLTTLISGGIRQVLLITTPHDRPLFERLLGDGSQWGITLSYAEQTEPRGIADAFLVGRNFIGGEPVCLILGDNILFGEGLECLVATASTLTFGAKIFGYYVQDPRRYGVVEFDAYGQVLSLEEKPARPKSNYAVPGLYFYDNEVVRIAEKLKPSARGELEITDVNKAYLARKRLQVEVLGPGTAWIDAGLPDALLEAGNFIRTLELCLGIKIGCPEEAAWKRGYIDRQQVLQLAQPLANTEYGQYLLRRWEKR